MGEIGGVMKISRILSMAVFMASFAQAAEIVTTEKDRTALSMTVYANGLAMVQDQRQVHIPQGRHMLSYEGVSNQLNAPSALFGGQDLSVLQQVFDYALLSDENMLRLSEGKKIKLWRSHPESGEDIIEEALIITTKPQLVLQTERGIETQATGRIIFTEIPQGLSKAPALKLFLEAKNTGEKKVDLTYLSDGFSWRADYIGRLNKDRTKIEIRALATINNNTEVSYNNARMSVIAGDVQRQYNNVIMAEDNMILEAKAEPMAEAIGNFQLFKLPELVSLESQQTRQFPLLPIKEIDVKQVFEASHYFYGQQEDISPHYIERPISYINFTNNMQSPMPQGVFRVYESDSEGKDHFTGEMYMPDTAEGEPVRLKLGEAYDLRIYRKQSDWSSLILNGGKATYEVRVTNGSNADAMVLLRENIRGNADVKSKAPYRKENSTNYVWELHVPAKGEATLSYTLSSSIPKK